MCPPTKRSSVVCTVFIRDVYKRQVLEQSLPYLQELPVFSYGFTGNGELLPPALDDSWMITAAVSAGVTPILTLTPFGPDGNFNNALIHSMVQSETAKNNLISQLLQIRCV